jgi:DNA-binding GntR family transcriptional regulator
MPTLLSPARRQPLAADIGGRLRAAILQGEFLPGDRLRETELAELLQVSRGPIREALADLAREGLVVLRPNRGAVVARLSRDDLDEVYSLRLALERLAVARAARLATDQDFEAMQAVLREFSALRVAAQAEPLSARILADADIRFHDTIYRAAHHRRLYGSWSTLRSQVYMLLLARDVATPGFDDMTFEGHRQIAHLIRTRQEERLQTIVEAHLRESYRRVLTGSAGAYSLADLPG